MCRPVNAQPCTWAGQLFLFPTWTRPSSLANTYSLTGHDLLLSIYCDIRPVRLTLQSPGSGHVQFRMNVLHPFLDLKCEDEDCMFFKTVVPTHQGVTTQMMAISDTRRPQETAHSRQLCPTGVMNVAQYNTDKPHVWLQNCGHGDESKKFQLKSPRTTDDCFTVQISKPQVLFTDVPADESLASPSEQTPVSGSVRTNAVQYVLHNPLIP